MVNEQQLETYASPGSKTPAGTSRRTRHRTRGDMPQRTDYRQVILRDRRGAP